MTRLSLVVTTYNNEATLAACLASASFCDELLVLDSGSTDRTLEIAARFSARVHQQVFESYGRQKWDAIRRAANDWVLLLDADEMLSDALGREIRHLMKRRPAVPAYRLRRAEWLYWRWPHSATRLTDHLRLFHRDAVFMDDHPVHAAPKTDRPVNTLTHALIHYGEKNLHTKIDKINHYTSESADYLAARPNATYWRLAFAPYWAFIREYFIRRQFLNGWAGFIAARGAAFHSFLKYAKVAEARRDTPIDKTEFH